MWDVGGGGISAGDLLRGGGVPQTRAPMGVLMHPQMSIFKDILLERKLLFRSSL